MFISDLNDDYTKSAGVNQLTALLAGDRSKIHARGIVGSGASLIAYATMLKHGGVHVFILPDKEEAAYILNDLESAAGKIPGEEVKSNVLSIQPYFFPRSARQAYETEETDNANVAMRAEVLNDLRKNIQLEQASKPICIITYPEAIAEKVITQSELSGATFEITQGNSLDIEFVDEWMHTYGFEKVDYVYEPGQYAIRGGIIDIFSFSFDHPYRIELFGNDVESIRKFEPDSQLSVAKMTKATIVPNVTMRTTEESRINLLDFLPSTTCVWIKDTDGALNRMDVELEKAQKLFDKQTGIFERTPPGQLYSDKQSLNETLQLRRVIEFGSQRKFAEGTVVQFDMEPQPAFNKNFDLLSTNLTNNAKSGYTNAIAAGQPKQIERLYQIFSDKNYAVHFTPLTVEFSEGFIDKENKILIYTDHQIFERYHRFRLKEGFKKNKEALTIKEIMSLQPGDYVVHIDHGVGQFSGLQKIDVNGKEQEAIRLTYKGGDILYVSIHSLHRISKFVGKEGSAPSMDKLGSNAWQTLKRKTKTKVKEIAFDLIKLYAKRKATKGHAFQADGYMQHELEASFMYEDTPDQLKATQAVKEDMEAEAPMDRLVCGDVGFGKTEIAIRAAFKAATDGKQVAVLVPTTILSLQHYKSFASRF
ncbi:MAG: CarD family transcriptional regulator, partial [Flavobacteriales bacterium]